jgi:hypothetical protein
LGLAVALPHLAAMQESEELIPQVAVPLSLRLRILAVLLLTAACSGDGTIEDVPAASEMPLGSDNPCWGGVYPDDLDGIGILESDILVDRETDDMYDSVCIEARISQYNEDWPAGMDERLVRASDLK